MEETNVKTEAELKEEELENAVVLEESNIDTVVTEKYERKCKVKGEIPYALDHGESHKCESFAANEKHYNYELTMKLIKESK